MIYTQVVVVVRKTHYDAGSHSHFPSAGPARHGVARGAASGVTSIRASVYTAYLQDLGRPAKRSRFDFSRRNMGISEA